MASCPLAVQGPRGAKSRCWWLLVKELSQLEELFGILQTMVGNDSSIDIHQLVLHLVSTTEVSSILAQHPEWDQSPCWMKLPTVSREGVVVHKNVDHIKPASWEGDVTVMNVNLNTCWMLGQQEVRTSVKYLLDTTT